MGLNVSLNLEGKKALVVGGGKIAYHKASKLIKSGAVVTVISPEVDVLFEELACEIFFREYETGDEAGFFVVVCATDDKALNQAIFDDCDGVGILCLSATNVSHMNMNATANKGDITVSVSTNGKDPGFAKHLCKKFVGEIDEQTAARFETHARLRNAVVRGEIISQDNHALLRRALEMSADDIEDILKRGRE
ncbi:MAG: bifunctional precorrin-2 dehydrogenase/sirohydrochlorin ferrochelatase [Clostridia bacterium]|jgi:precorrin-2 dehydrogenase / sirohydrochlorin ferrochelatase|nr:bifunctional precorrin-2 dehydrogenase/sirohydrochlorin ferrochelatase [Clostridia bacterium]